MSTRTLVFLLTTCLICCGCTPRTFVRKNPADCDKGIRYYRPKPYLALKPHTGKDGAPVEGYVSVNLEYLPDFSEEYSIHVKTGLGSNKTAITLDQGWNLSQLNVEVDSQTDETIGAVGSLLGSAAGLAKSADGADGFVVRATNVPMGYYESVIGKHCGRKHLYGFRYVGFMPFTPCPVVPCGTPQPFECSEYQGELYGLVFENGVMTFKSLGGLRGETNETGLNQYIGKQDVQILPGRTSTPAADPTVELLGTPEPVQ